MMKRRTQWANARSCAGCPVRFSGLFAGLTDEDFDLLHEPIHEVELVAGDALYHQGDDASFVVTVREGLVKNVVLQPNGDERIVRMVRPGGASGLEALRGGDYAHTAVAMSKVSACFLPASAVNALAQETPRMHESLMGKWHDALQDADFWMSALHTGTARQRVSRFLLALSDAQGRVSILPKRADMASVLGLTTETVSRVVADFRREGWLLRKPSLGWEINRHSIEIEAEDAA